MNLWIRSQDGEKLCKVNDLIIRENKDENNEINYVIQDIYTMGIYKTKQIALEVLDQIEKHIKWLATLSYREREISTYRPEIIYQMPKE